MFTSEIKIRVRYSETDRMGFVYYGNYAQYFEVARVEALREMGFSYKEMEDKGILLPVIDFSIRYFKPAHYDDLLSIKTSIMEMPGVKITFHYECMNESGVVLNIGKVTLAFTNALTGKPCAPPEWFSTEIKKYFDA